MSRKYRELTRFSDGLMGVYKIDGDRNYNALLISWESEIGR